MRLQVNESQRVGDGSERWLLKYRHYTHRAEAWDEERPPRQC